MKRLTNKQNSILSSLTIEMYIQTSNAADKTIASKLDAVLLKVYIKMIVFEQVITTQACKFKQKTVDRRY